MPRTCTICKHEKREEIDQALVNGESLRNIASRYGTTSGSLKRHKHSHLPQALKDAKQAEIILSSENILEKMQDLHNKTLQIFDDARRRRDDRISISAAREVRENIKLLSELTPAQGQAGGQRSGRCGAVEFTGRNIHGGITL
jgi:hypothetical protein